MACASVVVTQVEDRAFFSLWLLSNHPQQNIAHQQIMQNHDVTAVAVFDQDALAGVDVVYLSPSLDNLQLTDQETEALIDFVTAGGRLIIPADNGVWADEFRSLAARFDVTYGDSFINGIQIADVEDFNNQITNGPAGQVTRFTGAAVNDNLNSSNPDFRVLARWQVGPASIGYLEIGQGQVVFLSDFNTFDNDMINDLDNNELWTNLFATTGPDGPVLSALGSCPGPMRFRIDDATPGENVALIYARGTGNTTIPDHLPCAGTTLGLDNTAQLAGVVRADANGTARFDANVPANACNRIHIQAIDLADCQTSNVILIE